jgi:hypothetical protein
MADITWSGGATPNLLASQGSNWVGGVAPVASDNVIFTTGTDTDCWWDIPSITNITHSATDMCLVFGATAMTNHTITGVFTHGGEIGVSKTLSTNCIITFNMTTTNPIFVGEHQSYYNSTPGETSSDATATNVTTHTNSISKLEYWMSGSVDIVWPNGYYPTVKTVGWSTPHAPQDGENPFYHEVDFYALILTSTASFRQVSRTAYASSARAEANKVFRVRSLTTNKQPFDGGKAQWIFYADTAGWELPLSGSNIMSGSQTPNKLENIRVAKSQNTVNKIFIPPGQHYIKKLIVDAGVNMSCSRGIAELNIVSRPDIRGSWEFFTIADGIYRSAKSGMRPTLIQGGTNQTVYADTAVAFVDGDALNLNDPTLTYVKGTGTLTATAFVGDGSGLTGISGGGGGGVTAVTGTAPIVSSGGTTPAISITTVSPSANGIMTSVEHVKLSNIEASATADQTGAEIKVAYEAEADTNAFTDAEKTKLSGIATGAEVNVQSDWNSSSGDNQILNKPTIPTQYTDALALSAVEGEATLDCTGQIHFRAPVEVIATDPAPAITESGRVYGMTNTGPIFFTLPPGAPAGVQYVVINTLGHDIVIRLTDPNDTLNGVANGTALATTINNGTTIVCIGDVGAPSAWYVMGGI